MSLLNGVFQSKIENKTFIIEYKNGAIMYILDENGNDCSECYEKIMENIENLINEIIIEMINKKFENGDMFTGIYKNDMYNGEYITSNYNIYIGDFDKNFNFMSGKCIRINGEICEGTFNNFKLRSGTISFKSGIQHSGEFDNNEYILKGTVTKDNIILQSIDKTKPEIKDNIIVKSIDEAKPEITIINNDIIIKYNTYIITISDDIKITNI